VFVLEKFIIHGGRPLEGVVTVSGSKNSAVGIIPATVLVKGPCILDNVPEISDVFLLFEILFRRKVPQKFEGAVHFIGIVLLLGLMVLVTFKDIVKLFG
jgi:UDP-N-acetylglucosamine enolpyruvyl transferase